jgi:phage baseplate assembly protein W
LYFDFRSGATADTVDGNLYYDDTENANPWLVTGAQKNWAQWQALGYDANGFNVTPAFIDTTNRNLHVRSNSAALNAGTDGRTIGAKPCGDCYWWRLTTTGAAADSVHLMTWDTGKTESGFFWDAGVWRNENSYHVDVDLDSSLSGDHAGLWSIFTDGIRTDSTTFLDNAEIVDPDTNLVGLSSAAYDTTLIAAMIDDRPDTNMVSAAYLADTISGAFFYKGMAIEWENNSFGDIITDINTIVASTGVTLASGQYALITADILDELIAGYDTEGTVGDLFNDLTDSTTFATDTTDIKTAVDYVLTTEHGSGNWTTGTGADTNDVKTAVNYILTTEHGAGNWTTGSGADTNDVKAAVDYQLTVSHGAGNWTTGAAGDTNDIKTAVNYVLTTEHGAGAWTTGAGSDTNAIKTAVDYQLTVSHGSGSWAAAESDLGDGDYLHYIAVKDSSDDGIVTGARTQVWSTDKTTMHVNGSSNVAGVISTHLDAGDYAVISSKTTYYSARWDTITVAASNGDTSTIKLNEVTVTPAGDPDYCTMNFYSSNWVGDTIENLQLQIRAVQDNVKYGIVHLPNGWWAADTTDASGHASVSLVRSGQTTPNTNYEVWVQHIASSAVWLPVRFEITVPDSASASMAANEQ